ncbi:PRC-barrel domain-containing protein [Stieleria sp. TO1_6]|uniref:PRC-barrel domain-containing protein n=1 Tax=Stieleria tagensis TaxID=2956795 RepID=UPI00209B25A5|nr:PRC-barrel domain-containing protein [Stieleria tagensis]MCO8123999.1 PRC-barrel domain-containing protein [Stieleria tagensis]
MLIAFHQIDGTKLSGSEEAIGTIKDLFLDQHDWHVRYAVVDTGVWLPGRRILVSPTAITKHDWGAHQATALLSHAQVESSPDVDLMRPVSRQMELELAKHYDWPAYWASGLGLGGEAAAAVPPSVMVPNEKQHEIEDQLLNVRSAHEILGYSIHATDGDIGHVNDFIIDDETWAVRYLVVDTKNWLPAPKVLVAPAWIESVSWADQAVTVEVTCQQIKDSPDYDPLAPVNRGYEEHIYDFYGKERYWMP